MLRTDVPLLESRVGIFTALSRGFGLDLDGQLVVAVNMGTRNADVFGSFQGLSSVALEPAGFTVADDFVSPSAMGTLARTVARSAVYTQSAHGLTTVVSG